MQTDNNRNPMKTKVRKTCRLLVKRSRSQKEKSIQRTSGQLLWDIYPDISRTKVISNIRKILPKDLQPFAKNIGTYCLFHHERQCMWKRRNQEGIVCWSENEIFANYFFSNIYRELDRTSCYFHSQMIQLYNQKQPSTRYEWILLVLWASYCFRQVNKVETFMEFKNNKIPTTEEFEEYEQFVKRKQTSGQPFFTGAHQTSSFHLYIRFSAMTLTDNAKILKATAREINDIIDAAHQKDSKDHDNHSHKTKNKTGEDEDSTTTHGDAIHNCFKKIKKLPGLGEFFAWQVTCDLMESNCFVNIDDDCKNKTDRTVAFENGFCALGSGAKAGIHLIFPGVEKKKYSTLELAKVLTEKINKVLDDDLLLVSNNRKKEKCFPKWNNKSLTLKNVEHSLCGYGKYILAEAKIIQRDKDPSEVKSAPGNSLMKLTSHFDIPKPCQICNANKDIGLFCDTCLNFYCEDCETGNCEKQPTSSICNFCEQFNQITFHS